MTPERAALALDTANITFLFAPLFHPVMKKLAPLRRELGVRTVFNLAGPLSNPVEVRRQIVGVDRPERVPVVAGALAALGTERALVFCTSPAATSCCRSASRTWPRSSPGGVRRFGLESPGLRGGRVRAGGAEGGDSVENADLLRRILDGEKGPCRDTVIMNAAAALVVAGAARDYVDGARRAAALDRLRCGPARARALMDVSRGIGA